MRFTSAERNAYLKEMKDFIADGEEEFENEFQRLSKEGALTKPHHDLYEFYMKKKPLSMGDSSNASSNDMAASEQIAGTSLNHFPSSAFSAGPIHQPIVRRKSDLHIIHPSKPSSSSSPASGREQSI